MIIEKMCELQVLTLMLDSVITPDKVDREGCFEFKGILYDYNKMAKRQRDLFEEFIENYKVDDIYVIEDTEKSE